MDDDGDEFMMKAIAGFVGYEVLDSKKIFPLTGRSTRGTSTPARKIPIQRFMCCFHFGSKRPKQLDAIGKSSSIEASLARDDSKRSSLISCSTKSRAMSQTITEKGLLRKWTPLCDCESRISWVDSPEGKKAIISENTKIAQISDLTELNKPWPYEHGGKQDTLQPVTGWWVVRTNEGTYGQDLDVPDGKFS
jgi:hypothetical protein